MRNASYFTHICDADVHENMLFKCTEIKINFVCTNDGCGIDILSHGDLSYEKMPT